jgi:hypothetical protein
LVIQSIRLMISLGMLLLVTPIVLAAQVQRDAAPLIPWSAPLYWQPNNAESEAAAVKEMLAGNFSVQSVSADITASAQTPANSLVFVGMTPCRIADTRAATFPAGFGPPGLIGGMSRTFAIQSLSSPCLVPPIAQAYSLNITVVPPGAVIGSVNPSGALGHLSLWPTGVPQPVVSTLNSYLGTVVANAAIVPAGTNGSVDVYVTNNTDFIIDINGYYASQSGITLAQGTAGAPSMSFAGDAGTGIFSPGTGAFNIATGGANRVSVTSAGNVGIGTSAAQHRLSLSGGPTWTAQGWTGALSLDNGSAIGWRGNAAGQRYGIGQADGGLYFFQTASEPGTTGSPANYIMNLSDNGNVGIGTITPTATLGRLQVQSNLLGGTAVYGTSSTGEGIVGTSSSGIGVHGSSATGTAGLFNGEVLISDNLGVGTDVPLRRLHVDGRARIGSIPLEAPTFGSVCFNFAGDLLQCNGSSLRFKTNVKEFRTGLDIVRQLSPISFDWKEDGRADVGLAAEDVFKVAPSFTLTDSNGEVAGVKYERLNMLLINAVKDQQVQIEDQQKRITEQQEQMVQQQEQNRKLEERLAALEALLSARSATR